MLLSRRARSISPSPTLAITAQAKKMKEEGIEVISFGAGEPDFDTPQNIKEAALKAMREGFTKYTPTSGIEKLKEAIVYKFKRDNNLDYDKSQIIVSSGAKHSLYNLIQTLCNPDDEVIIPTPFWVSYPEMVKLAEAKPVFVRTSEKGDFKLSKDKLKGAISKRVKLIILNSPSNPAGAVYSRKELAEIAKVVLENNLYLVSDEIYEKIIYGNNEHCSIASLGEEIKERTIVVNGVSKTYSMTGWRIGYLAGSIDLVKVLSRLQDHSTSCPNSIAQMAAVEALIGPQEEVKLMVREFNRRRRYIVDKLNNIPGISCFNPAGTFYVFPNISKFLGLKFKGKTISSSSSLASYLLSEVKVAVVPGIAFGEDNYLRLSYATSLENIKVGIKRMREALRKLKS